ncbi:transporter [Virgisporangium aliadipatigenens]|uniref:Transporter n=1 Tax=Virgisporangium aliadipatigenens TaxID=741659 RepID=A0A8J3YDV8_9ACTN|nr:alpha/beta hydrolase [Virgisporangium aliadipatigenens]GIJ43264.1 transporter [Virgisporangium aliadipatigenens]
MRRALLAIALATVGTVVVVESPAAAAPREPDTAALAGPLTRQTLAWEECVFEGISDAAKELFKTVPGLACATITVPADWHHPRDGRTMKVRISKTATAGQGRQGIALVNPGGPGGSGLVWGAAMATRSPELAQQYDFVGFDPRGVGASTLVPCRVEYDPEQTYTVDQETKLVVDGCRSTPLSDLITTEQTAYDMDFIRVLLGERKTSYVGYSYGTWLGMWYAATFPSKVHRMLLDSSIDVSQRTLEKLWDLQPRSRDRAFQEQLLPYVARHPQEYGLGTDPMEIRRRWEEAGGTRSPIGLILTAFFMIPAFYNTADYPIAAFVVQYVIENGSAATLSGAADFLLSRPGLTEEQRGTVREEHARAANGEVKPVRISGVVVGRTATTEIVEVDATFEQIRCQDGQWHQSRLYWELWRRDLERNAPFIYPFMTATPACAYWPTSNRMPAFDPRTFPKVLVLQAEMDAATPYEGGKAGVDKLPGARLVSVDNEGTHGVYPYLTSCVDDPVHAYFLSGSLPRDRYTACQGLPLPGEQATFDVGGTIGPRGDIKIRMVTDDVRRANRMVREILRDQAEEADPVTTS